MDSPPPADCCANRPGRFRGSAITEISELSPLVKPVNPERGAQVLRYVCTVCGQPWEDWLMPFMHADVHVVVKTGVPPALEDAPGRWAPGPPLKPAKSWILGVCVAAGFVAGLATLPPIDRGVADRQFWLLLCMAVGAIAAGIYYGLRRLLRSGASGSKP